MEPDTKKLKTNGTNSTTNGNEPATCQHIVTRKKRFCRITVANGEKYCGEHLPLKTDLCKDLKEPINKNHIRIACPLDPKHTVYEKNLAKHLKICNAKVTDQPVFIVPGLNSGPKSDHPENTDFKLSEISDNVIDSIIEKINIIYAKINIDDRIEELCLNHPLLENELKNETYGTETLKHLRQTSAILGYLDYFNLISDNTSYIEFGAGKGQVSFWLAQAITKQSNSNVLLIDKAALRHKKDNKLDESHTVERIRADISDFDIRRYELIQRSKQIVGVSKHLCGVATDFTIRCILNGNKQHANVKDSPKTIAFIIALCCHHRCNWQPFAGKEFFIQNNISEKEFVIITKMVGWAICGTGMSRERRKIIEEQSKHNQVFDERTETIQVLRDQRKEIGRKCKRLIDYARICFLEENGYKCLLKSYVDSTVTLENICLIATLKTN